MTDLAERAPPRTRLPTRYGLRATLTAALSAAAWAAAMGLVADTVVVMSSWASSGSTAGAAVALRVAAGTWLLSQHVGLSVGTPTIHLGLVPLGLFVLPVLLLYRAGLSVARVVGISGWRDGWLAIGGMAAGYAVIAGVVAGMTTSADVRPAPLQSLLVPWLLAACCGTLGAMRHDRMGRRLLQRLPGLLADCLRAGTTSVLVLLGAATVLVAGSLLDHLDTASRLSQSLHAGSIGGVALLVVNAALLVTAVVWALSYLVGAGFSLGTGTSVTPWEHHLGAVPDLPVLAAVPAGPSPTWTPWLLVVPILAGLAAGWWLGGRQDGLRWWQSPLAGLGVGLVAGLLVAGLAALAGGPAGAGRLMTLGPSAWRAGLMTAAEVGAGAGLASVLRWLVRRYEAELRGVARQAKVIILPGAPD